MRIQKIIAQTGIASRRAAEDLIKAGRVHVNGIVASLGDKLTPGDKLEIDGKTIKYNAPTNTHARLLLLNKPTGIICSHNQITEHPLVYELLPKLLKGKWMTVGRLDLNSKGLLLVTNNGDLLHRLLHPKQALKRVYKVRVRGDISESIQAQLLSGIVINGHQCKFHSMTPLQKGNTNSSWQVTLYEGKNREIRDLFAAVNCQVNSLKRIAYGPFKLPADLPSGHWYEIPLDVLEAKL